MAGCYNVICLWGYILFHNELIYLRLVPQMRGNIFVIWVVLVHENFFVITATVNIVSRGRVGRNCRSWHSIISRIAIGMTATRLLRCFLLLGLPFWLGATILNIKTYYKHSCTYIHTHSLCTSVHQKYTCILIWDMINVLVH